MDTWHQWGIDVIIAVQQMQSPFADSFFRAVTSLGDEGFYLLLLPLLFWCVNYRLGARLTIVFLLSVYLNTFLKDVWGHPRPFDLDASLMRAEAGGFGLPSGHAQLSVVVWGMLAAWLRGRWAWGLAALLVVLISFSRLYLGVHFPTDVAVGLLIGGATLAAWLLLGTPLEKSVLKLPLIAQLALALGIPLLLTALYPTRETITVTGALAGGAAGLVLLYHLGGFDASGTLVQRGVRLGAGLFVFIGLYLALKVILPDEDSTWYLAGRGLRYGLLGIWAGLGAPLVFIRAGLAKRPASSQPAVTLE